MPDGNQPISGKSGPTWNDGMIMGEIIRAREAGLSETEIRRGFREPTPEQRRRWHRRYSILNGIIAWVCVSGAITDPGALHLTWLYLLFAGTFGFLTLSQVHRARSQPVREERQQRKRLVRAIIFGGIFAVTAVAFAAGALGDYLTKSHNPFGSLVFAGLFGLLALYQAWRLS